MQMLNKLILSGYFVLFEAQLWIWKEVIFFF